MRSIFFTLGLILLPFLVSLNPPEESAVYYRFNQVGFLPEDFKAVTIFSNSPVNRKFEVVETSTGDIVYKGKIEPYLPGKWGNFNHYYKLAFSELKTEGRYFIRLPSSGSRSAEFSIASHLYSNYEMDVLGFMRQQRCGYNPFFDVACHQLDGRTFYGPFPDSTYVDVSGGWHDAGDQLRYLITSSFATGFMLKTYELYPDQFGDEHDAYGRPGKNGLPDILDEAKWGLDWLIKIHPGEKVLIHQIADDRDHIGWKYPHDDTSDYGWGPNSYRVAYVANGKPQGLREYKSESTGLANLAGRTSAALSIGYRIWKDIDPAFAANCLKHAREIYFYGKEHEGYQQGNSYGAPYRYTENTWADDMEWGAAELLKSTGEQQFKACALRYARLAATDTWMDIDSAAHYEKYPFLNMGHFALWDQVDENAREEMSGYYRSGIEKSLERAKKNPFEVGAPFIWCSNNLVTSLVTQIILYEIMTGDKQFHELMIANRDWLFGHNPWGTSMFMNIPGHGDYPVDVHTSTWALTRKEVPGGLVDGPVSTMIYKNLKGLHLTKPDDYQAFQNDIVVYHDDIGDYSTNEPTMDGTASTLMIFAHFNR